jgi:hypothetical protein
VKCDEESLTTHKLDIKCSLLFWATREKKDFVQNIWDKVCGYWVLGEQIGNIISDCWALGENMKEPYRIQLGTPNSKK